MLWRHLTDPGAELSQPGEWGQRGPDQERRHIGHSDLALELKQDAREVRKPWESGTAEATRQTQRLVLREELLHAQRWTRLYIGVRGLPALGAEPVGLSWRDNHRLTGARHDRLTAESEAHLALYDGKALLLDGVDRSEERRGGKEGRSW